jgi:hypothetical protein
MTRLAKVTSFVVAARFFLIAADSLRQLFLR